MSDPSQDVKKVDKLLEQFPEKAQFINFVQSPDYLESLKAAVPFLIEHWPTDEQIQTLDENLKNPHRAPNQLDRKLVAGLRSGKSLEAISSYNAEEVSSAENAEIFWNLSLNRPWKDDTFYRWKDTIDDTFGRSLFLIARN
jgi:hypothetical protein